MKFSFTLLIFILGICYVQSQQLCASYNLDFENDEEWCNVIYHIDTVTNQNNIWDIGSPSKTRFDSAYSFPNVIVTDRLESYPKNDTSSFIIKSRAEEGFEQPRTALIFGKYWVDSDSLNDYGIIEFSPDNGNSWINLLSDSLDGIVHWWYDEKPVLTGNSNGWKSYTADLWHLLVEYDLYLQIDYGDTIAFRYTFISDSIEDNRGGLMLDNLSVLDGYEGTETAGYDKFHSKVYPNPVSSSLIIEFDNPDIKPYDLTIYDNLGRQVLLIKDLSKNQVELNVQNYHTGIYYYKLLNENEKKGTWGKFIVE